MLGAVVLVRRGMRWQVHRRGMGYLLGFGGGNRPWQSLARKLQDEGFESKYLDRLQKTVTCDQAVDELEREILREMGGALRRMEDRLNYKLLLLEVAGRDIGRAEEASRPAAIKQFNAVREEAILARRDMSIQREAAGMRIRNWEKTQRLYPIPPPCPSSAKEAPKCEDEGASIASEQHMKSLVAAWKLSK
mmetsp:Transcript_38123/g.91951  ORF Transcript_38123/g.91951 Transcript_38123/m.91951 type:complete len:191 (+) Transcript_38123:41-613(+)